MAKNKKSTSAPDTTGAEVNKKPVVPSETFSDAEGKEYEFKRARFIHNGKLVVASDLLKIDIREVVVDGKKETEEYFVGEQTLAELIEMKAGVIAQIKG